MFIAEGAAGVSGIDGGVGLDQGKGASVVGDEGAVYAADDAFCYRSGKFRSAGVAHGVSGFADFRLFIGELRGGQPFFFRFQQRQIGSAVIADNLGLRLAVVGKNGGNGFAVGNDMVVGYDVAAVIDDHAAAAAFRRGGNAVGRNRTGGADAHHRGKDFLSHLAAVHFIIGFTESRFLSAALGEISAFFEVVGFSLEDQSKKAAD